MSCKIAMFHLAVTFGLSAQVNTESMRGFNVQPGLGHAVSLQFGYISGNSDVSTFSASYRADWLTEHYYSFGVANYQRGASSGKLNVRKGFIHLRTSRSLSARWIAEAFVQKEFNDFWRLEDRQLGGLGLRLENAGRDSSNRVRRMIAVGSGFMREHEQLEKPLNETINQWRSTSYLSLIWSPGVGVDWSATTYAQVAVQRTSDYRILHESRLSFHVWKNLSFGTSFRYRFDHEPPAGVRKHDIELTNGLSMRF